MTTARFLGSIRYLVTGLLAAGGCLMGSMAAHAAKPVPGLGVNIYMLTSTSSEIPFVDVFKMSSPWIIRMTSQPRVLGTPHLTRDGWIASLDPGQYAETTILNGQDGKYPAGIYTIFYEGEGKLTFGTHGAMVMSQQPGQVKLMVSPWAGPGDGILIREMQTNAANPLRNIRVILPGYEDSYKTQTFNPVFLKALAPFKTLRFMAFNRTNRADTVEWADRRTPDYETQASEVGNAQQKLTGVALEYQIDLANQLNADPWFNVPIKASDDYIRHMAMLVKTRLKPNLHPYIEFSNEVWNTHFSDGSYAQQMGQQAGLSGDPRIAGLYWYVKQTERMFDIWNQVYGSDSSRIVHVLGSFFNWSNVSEVELPYDNVYQKADAVAVAPYIMPKPLRDPHTYDQVAGMSKDDVLKIVEDEVLTGMKKALDQQMALAKKYNIALVAYEGGPSLESTGVPNPNRGPITDLFIDVNRDPRLSDIYRELLDEWFQAGGTTFLHFNSCFYPAVYGSWGLLEYQDQDPSTAPKYKMVTDYIASHHFARMP